MKGPERIDHITNEIDRVLAEYSETADPAVIAELALDGLKEAVRGGWMNYNEAENLYYQHFTRIQHEPGTEASQPEAQL